MKRFFLTLVVAVVCVVTPLPLVAHDEGVIRFTIDVAENFEEKFVSTPVSPNDIEPVRGSWFITEGRIFPGGFIQGNGGTFDPTSSAHHSIGTWQCRGSHLIGLSGILQGGHPWVMTSQMYLLPDDRKMLTTEGLEGSQPVVRVVTGGTGKFAGYVGEQHQTLLGFNTTGGVNLRVTFVLRRAAAK